MKKEWKDASIKELNISATEHYDTNEEEYDDTFIGDDGKKHARQGTEPSGSGREIGIAD